MGDGTESMKVMKAGVSKNTLSTLMLKSSLTLSPDSESATAQSAWCDIILPTRHCRVSQRDKLLGKKGFLRPWRGRGWDIV